MEPESYAKAGSPLHRENRKNGQTNSLTGKTQGNWKFGQNTGQKKGTLCAQVVNSLIQKIKDIAIFAPELSNLSKSVSSKSSK